MLKRPLVIVLASLSASLFAITAAEETANGAAQESAQEPPEVVRLAEPVQLFSGGGVAISTGAYNGHSGPLLADLNGDGKDDLLLGNFKGHVQVFTNVGTKERPKYRDDGLLKAREKDLYIHNW